MLKVLKPPGPAPADDGEPELVAMLRTCHERIRRFLALGQRLAAPDAPSAGEVSEAAQALRRYFTEALPLHVRDEEETLRPRLAGHDAAVDAALAAMAAEHQAHEAAVERLLQAVAPLAEQPERHAALAGELEAAVTALAAALLPHLQQEEEILFPAIARLCDAAAHAAMVAELRQRRQR